MIIALLRSKFFIHAQMPRDPRGQTSTSTLRSHYCDPARALIPQFYVGLSMRMFMPTVRMTGSYACWPLTARDARWYRCRNAKPVMLILRYLTDWRACIVRSEDRQHAEASAMACRTSIRSDVVMQFCTADGMALRRCVSR